MIPPRAYPYTPLVKFGERFAPAVFARTTITPAYPGETWLQALARVAKPPVNPPK